MGISVEEAIHELRNREEVFVAYSQATKLPYVTCDEETFNDQARIFATEEEIKEYGKQLLEDKILLMGMKYEKKDYPRLYGTLYAIGVNSVLWIDGENQTDSERYEPDRSFQKTASESFSGTFRHLFYAGASSPGESRRA